MWTITPFYREGKNSHKFRSQITEASSGQFNSSFGNPRLLSAKANSWTQFHAVYFGVTTETQQDAKV